MRIGISTSVIQSGQTGIGQYLFGLVGGLIDRGEHELTLFCLEKDIGLFAFAADKVHVSIVDEKYRPPLMDLAWHHFILPGLARRWRLDVLHAPSYRRMLWSRPCPLVATIHDLAQFHVKAKYSRLRMFYGRVVAPRLARRQNHIVAISENTAADVARFFKIPRRRMTVIHNGIDHRRFFPGDKAQARAAAARQFGLEQPFILYVARLEHPGKNHVRLVAAFEKFKEATESPWTLALAGADWHGAGQIHDAIRGCRRSKDIHCLGFVPDASLPDLYRAAEVFIYPSLFEGFGMPPVEAMACACPVIASGCGSLGEVLGDAAARVNPESVEEMAAQMAAQWSRPERRRQLVEAGLTQAGRFTWAAASAKTVEVYEEAARGGVNHRPDRFP